MERQRARVKSKPVGIDSDIPSAPTLEDFYFDPGISIEEEASPTFHDPLGVAQFSTPSLTEAIQQLDISARGDRLTCLMLKPFLFLVLTESAVLESSAPQLSPPSAPAFPDLSEQLEYMNPHFKVVLKTGVSLT